MIEAGAEAVHSIVGELIPSVGGEAPEIAMAVYLAMRTLAMKAHG